MEVFAVILLVFFLVFAVAAMILRAACSLVGEPKPDLGRAIIIVLGVMLAHFVVGLVLHSLSLGVLNEGKVLSTLVSAAVTSWVYSKMLPTSFGRALVIWLAQFVVCFILGMVVFFTIMAVVGGFMVSGA